jgi:hypothetical protein
MKADLEDLKAEIDEMYPFCDGDIIDEDDVIIDILLETVNEWDKILSYFKLTKQSFAKAMDVLLSNDEFEYAAKLKDIFESELLTYLLLANRMGKTLGLHEETITEQKRLLCKMFDPTKTYIEILTQAKYRNN